MSKKVNKKLIWVGVPLLIVLIAIISGYLIGDTYAYTTNSVCPEGYTFMGAYCRKLKVNANDNCRPYNEDVESCYVLPKTAYTYTLTYYVDGKKKTEQCSGTFDSPNVCVIRNLPSLTKTGYKFKGWGETQNCTNGSSTIAMNKDKRVYPCWEKEQEPQEIHTAHLVLNGGNINGNTSTITRQCTATASTLNTCVIRNLPTPTKENNIFKGWGSSSTCTSGNYVLTINADKSFYACWQPEKKYDAPTTNPSTSNNNGTSQVPVTESTANGESGGTTNEGTEIIYVTKPEIINYYDITYNLDGGEFLDGTKSRKETVSSRNAVGAMKLNPIKEGYKFVEWQLDGKTFDFSTKLTSDVTLTAVYEPFDEYEHYTCDEGYDVFDPSTNECYRVMEPDNSNTYNYTSITYNKGAKYCWGYYTDEDSNDEKRYVLKGSEDTDTNYVGDGAFALVDASATDEFRTITGKNNATYDGYDKQDFWVSNNECEIGTKCTEKNTWRSTESCEIRYDAIIYSSKPATYYNPDEELDDNGDYEGDNNTDNSDNADNSSTGGGKENNEANNNPDTDDAFIWIIVSLAVISIAVGIYYFHKNKKKDNIGM